MSITVNIVRGLQKMFPGIDFLKDVQIQDDSDGRGPYIKSWSKAATQPTLEEIDAADKVIEVEAPVPYPTVDEQLKMIYADMKYGTSTFVKAIDKASK